MFPPPKILIIKASSLGDIVQTFDVLSYIKWVLPDATIDWVVEEPFSKLVSCHPYVHCTFLISTRKWRQGWLSWSTLKELWSVRKKIRRIKYDYVFDFQANVKSSFVLWFSKAKIKIGFQLPHVSDGVNVLFTHKRYPIESGISKRAKYLSLVKQVFYTSKKKFVPDYPLLLLTPMEQKKKALYISHWKKNPLKKVMISWGSQWENKKMSPLAIHHFLNLLKNDRRFHVVLIWGNEKERDLVEKLNTEASHAFEVLPKVSLPLLQNLMKEMDFVISVDSLALHLSATTCVPTLGIFGPSSAQQFMPEEENHFSIQGKCPYRKYLVAEKARCNYLRTCPTGLCMKQITGEWVYEQFLNWIAILSGKKEDVNVRFFIPEVFLPFVKDKK